MARSLGPKTLARQPASTPSPPLTRRQGRLRQGAHGGEAPYLLTSSPVGFPPQFYLFSHFPSSTFPLNPFLLYFNHINPSCPSTIVFTPLPWSITHQVIPVSGGVICRVEVRAHRANYDPKNGEKDVGGKETAGALRTAQNKRLVDAFGSTRRQRQLANTESSMVDVERVGASEVVAGMMAKAQMEAREAGMTKDQVRAGVGRGRVERSLL